MNRPPIRPIPRPRRRPAANPLIMLVSLAVTVAMALAVVWQWAGTKLLIEAEPALLAAQADTQADTERIVTPILSLRRAPGVLSRRLNIEQFAEELQPLLDSIDSTSCSAVAVDGQVVASDNADLAVIPASTQKLLVAAVSLDVLGPNYDFTTTAVGEIGADGVIAGDLAIIGGGDPVLSTDWWPTSGQQSNPPINTTRLEELADAVVAAGAIRISGRVVGDGSRYDDEFFGPSWDPSLWVGQGGPYDALLVNDARVSPAGDFETDPALGAARVFVQLLRDRGVPVGQGAAAGTAPLGTEIAAVTSQPLSAILAEMLLTSDNNTAEMLVKEIGLVDSGLGATEPGLLAISNRLLGWGVPVEEAQLVDGSGLSRDNRVTCALLVALLAHGSSDDSLGDSLPVAASSGTLAEVFVGSSVAGSLRAKTGTLSGVKALAGYLPVDGGATIEFAVVLNTPGVDDGTGYLSIWEDELAPALSTYPQVATADDLGPR